MSDTPNTGTAEDEKKANALLALLYPEPGDALEGASEDVSAAELEEMQSLRALFRELPEEEPSPAVSNKLLAMAAQHAPVPKAARRGVFAWLSDILMPLMAHPGLAAAATLVLVVGVAGTLYVKGNTKLAEPMATSASPSPNPASLPAAVPVLPPPVPVVDETAVGEAKESAKAGLRDSPVDLGRATGKPGPQKKERREQAPTKNDSKPGGLLDSLAEDDSGSTYGSQRRRGAKKKSKDSAVPAKPRSVQAEKAPTTQAPSPSVDLEAQEVPEQDQDKTAERKAPEPVSRAATLHAQAIVAAARNDCKRVRQLSNKIRKLDSAYYDRTFLADDRLKACRTKGALK